MIEIKRIEDMGLVIEDLEHLHKSYWEEMQQHRESRYAPRFDLLKHYWQLGVVRSWGAFDDDRLVGHLTAFVTTSIHSGESVATEDRLYVLPEYRTGTGRALLKKAISDLRKEGVEELWATCEPITRVGPLLERQGFSHVANAYMMRLERMH